MGFYDAIESAEEVRFESCQLNNCPYVCRRWSLTDVNPLLIIYRR
jgi:hypothetical protein